MLIGSLGTPCLRDPILSFPVLEQTLLEEGDSCEQQIHVLHEWLHLMKRRDTSTYLVSW